MRILYFSRDYTTHDRRFLQKMTESRHEIFFLRLEDDGLGYEKRPLPAGVKAVGWPGGVRTIPKPEACLALLPAFTAILNELKPDLVQAGPVQSCGLMTAIAGFSPFIVVSWGSDILLDAGRDELWRWMTRYTLERSEMLFCDCDAVRHKVQQILPYDDVRIAQFPWGIDPSQFTPGGTSLPVRKRSGWEDAFIILSTRSWEPVYGIDVLIKAFAAAYERNNKLRLILMGNGSLEGEINGLIDSKGLGDAVFRTGRTTQEEIPEYFRAADLYLSCTHSDGTSISLLEAMASGLPVVVTDGPGNREWVTPGENGWLAPDNDVAAFAQALLDAAASAREIREGMGRKNRQAAEQRANWEINSAKMLHAYDLISLKYAHTKPATPMP